MTPEMRTFPQYKFAIMGLFDTLFNIFSTFPTPHLGGDTMNAIQQVVLPMNMVLAYLFLKTRYHKVHLIGGTLTVFGALINFIPAMTGQTASNAGPDSTNVGWITLAVLSMLPAAASNVYKEIGLKDADLDVWYANAWIGVWQLFWGMLTVWTVNVSAFQSPPIAWASVPAYIQEANWCFLGANATYTLALGNSSIPGSLSEACDGQALYVFLIFIVFNITYNQIMLFVFKRGSSVLFVIASAICLPLVDVLYIFPFIAGKAQENFSIYDGFALFALVFAIVIYYSEKEETLVASVDGSGQDEVVQKSPMLLSPRQERAHTSGASSGPLAMPGAAQPAVQQRTTSSGRIPLISQDHAAAQGLTAGYSVLSSST